MIRAANPTANSNADILSIAWKQPAAAVRWRPESLEVQGLDSVAAKGTLGTLRRSTPVTLHQPVMRCVKVGTRCICIQC